MKYHTFKWRQSVTDKLDQLLAAVARIEKGIKDMGPELQALVNQVTATAGAEASAVVAINGLAAQIAKLASQGGTPQQFTDLANQLKAATDPLAAAVAANPTTASSKKP